MHMFPGCFSGLGYKLGNADAFISALANDGVSFVGRSIDEISNTPQGVYPIAAFYTPSRDFHFYRRDENGLWSQKYGGDRPVQHDRNGVPVNTPVQAASYMPDLEFIGFFLMREPGYTFFPYRLDVMQRHKGGIILSPHIMNFHPEARRTSPSHLLTLRK